LRVYANVDPLVRFSGGTSSAGLFHLAIIVHDDSGCSGSTVRQGQVTTDLAGLYIITIPLASGQYSAQACAVNGGCSSCVDFTLDGSSITVSMPPVPTGTSIPEYPLGLPLLAIMTVIAYTILRRSAHVKQPPKAVNQD